MTIDYVIACGWNKGHYFAGRDTGTSLRWVSDIKEAVRFPSSYAASQYAATVIHLDSYKVESFVSNPSISSEEESECQT